MASTGLAGARHSRSFRTLLVAAGLFASATQPGLASQATARCSAIEQQFQSALKTHPGTKAAGLGAQARKLCGTGRPALGLRTYIKAFRVLGVDPDLPKD